MSENIVENKVQCITDNLEELMSTMQTNVMRYKKQQTELYWTGIRMSNNIRIYQSDMADIKALNSNVDEMINYSEKIINFAEDILKDDIKKVQECSDIELIAQYVKIIQEKMNVLLVFVTKHSEEHIRYTENIVRVKDKLELHRVSKKKTLWKRICGRI